MPKIPIAKYHGCGNDFLLVHAADVAGLDLRPLTLAACDRHTGIGADGLIIVESDPLEMRFYNADGSSAPMCGNGIRCVAAFCLQEGMVQYMRFPIRTGAGIKVPVVCNLDPFEVAIDMGSPEYERERIGFRGPEPWGYRLVVQGRTVRLYSFFLSTVHTVWFVKDALDDSLLPFAEAIHRDPIFAEKSNVDLVQVLDRRTIRMRTWERGAGLTLACGTGACAAAVAARKLDLCEEEVKVRLPGGQLRIAVDPDKRVEMTGPARRIMKGTYDYGSTGVDPIHRDR